MMRALTLIGCAVSSLALAAGEKPNPYLAQARVFYQGGEFKKCLDRVKQAEKWDSTTQEVAEVSLYAGLCRFNSKKQKEAEVDFLRALQTDPSLELPAATSPKIVEAWNRVRAKVPRPAPPVEPPLVTTKEPDRQPAPAVVATPAPAPAAVTLEPAPAPKAAPVAAFVMGGVAVAAVAAAVSFGLLASSNNVAAVGAPFQSDAVALQRTAQTYALVANLSYVTAGVAALTGLLLFFLQR
ncbi:MAG: hypothetical protein Q8S33_01945 [Myxococcales bacterium]|nr:hypothetical protein [Myxococcales bacterium]